MHTLIVKPMTLLWRVLLIISIGMTSISAEAAGVSRDDVSEPDLAQFAVRMQEEVEALRGREFKYPVNVGLYTEDQVKAFIEQQVQSAGGWLEGPYAEAAMKMIGLIPRSCGLLSTTRQMFIDMSPPGLYNSEAKELRVVKKPGMDFNSLPFQTICIHELAHALDDQHFDFEKMGIKAPATSDAEIVMGSILEGSAVTLQQRYLGKVMSLRKIDFSQIQESMSNIMGNMQSAFAAPLYIVTMFFARFNSGVSFLQFGERTLDADAGTPSDSGNTGRTPSASPFELRCIDRAMLAAATDLPRSSEQILHPEKYWREETRNEPIVVADRDVENLLARRGLRVVHKNTFGEIGCAVLTFPEGKRLNPMSGMASSPSSWTNENATGWGGDRFFLLSTETSDQNVDGQTERLCGIWFTTWDTRNDCEEFVENYEKFRPDIEKSMFRLGSRCAVYLLGFDDSTYEKVAESFQISPPGFTQDGISWSLSSTSE